MTLIHLYKELQPADTFDIRLPHALSTMERQLVTLFYQPLTGAEPISLYLTLWAEAEQMPKQQMNHYYLMNVLGLPIGKVFEARIALEAIGLLRTWKKEEAEQRSFLYELMRPLDADSFMKDPLLSMFLFSKIGEQAYRKLRQRFIQPVRGTAYKDVSRAFMDVFKPVNTNIPTDLQGGIDSKENAQKVYPFYFEQFDFELLQAGLSDQLVPANLLTLEVRETIAKLAFLYHLTALDMQKVVILALDDELGISQERLRKAAADFYKLTVSKEPPKLAKVYAPPVEEDAVQKTKDQELQHYLESTPPVQVLRDINNGKEPLQTSVQLAESLIVQHGMPVGVVNALLEYVMLSTDMKLPKSMWKPLPIIGYEKTLRRQRKQWSLHVKNMINIQRGKINHRCRLKIIISMSKGERIISVRKKYLNGFINAMSNQTRALLQVRWILKKSAKKY